MMRLKNGILSLSSVLLVVFIVAIVLIGDKISDIGNQLTVYNTQEVCRYRASEVMTEFRRTRNVQLLARGFFRKGEACREEGLLSLAEMLLEVDGKLSRVCFLEAGRDSLFVLERGGGRLRREALSVEEWPHLSLAGEMGDEGQAGGTFRVDSMLYWTTIERIRVDAGREMLLGFDILLSDLHAYFAEWKEPVNSYVFILNEEGMVLSHPDERLLGKVLMEGEEWEAMEAAAQGGKEVGMMVYSEFLSCPVYRVYYPFELGEERWMVAVNVPQFGNEEILADFHRYTLLIAVVTVFIFGVLSFYAQGKWRKENRLRNKVEQESMALQLRQLENQLNPHFLFNSLNSLSALITTDSSLAKEFVLRLSRVYRYLLEKRNDSLATVREELEFMNQYYFLQRIRFGEQLRLDAEVEEEWMEKKIPAMSLQMLVENAIKHNQITKMKPLEIRIYARDNFLVVENNYQPRGKEEGMSTGIGLERIGRIYEFYSSARFEYGQEGGVFVCRLPFIEGD